MRRGRHARLGAVTALLLVIGAGAAALADAGPTHRGVVAASAGPSLVSGCPLHSPGFPRSLRQGASSSLVPDTPNALLVCSYSGFDGPPQGPSQGPPGRLIATGSLTDPATVQRLASELDAIPDRTGPIACPADLGNRLVTHFGYASGPEDPVAIGLSGCNPLTNGRLNRLGLGARVV